MKINLVTPAQGYSLSLSLVLSHSLSLLYNEHTC